MEPANVLGAAQLAQVPVAYVVAKRLARVVDRVAQQLRRGVEPDALAVAFRSYLCGIIFINHY